MLKRVDADTFETDTGNTVTIVATSDDGAPSATFRYLKALPPRQVQGKPGCQFDVVQGVTMFSCAVVFGQGPAPRYDLFEVDDNGALNDLGVPLTPGTTGPTVQFRIDGLAVPVLAAAPRRSAARARRPSAGEKAAAKKKTPKAAQTTRGAKKKGVKKRVARKRTRGRR